MAIKLVELKQLGKETNETITSAKNEWISFLNFQKRKQRYWVYCSQQQQGSC